MHTVDNCIVLYFFVTHQRGFFLGHFSVSVRSKGGPHHEPHILVSGKDYSTHNEGINFVVVDYDSGIYPKQSL